MTDLSATHASLRAPRAKLEEIQKVKATLAKTKGELKARFDAHKALEASADPYLPLLFDRLGEDRHPGRDHQDLESHAR